MRSRYVEKKELEKLRLALGDGAFLPLALSLETGLRVGDVVSLKVADVKRDGIHYVAQKTGKRGVAKLSPELRRSLPKVGKWLFPSPYKKGKHITRQAVWARVKSAGKKIEAELSGLSPHSMRKVFAVELYREKGFKAVQEALQHSYSSTTELYSFADWDTGENADVPLTRRDLQLIIKMVLEALGQ